MKAKLRDFNNSLFQGVHNTVKSSIQEQQQSSVGPLWAEIKRLMPSLATLRYDADFVREFPQDVEEIFDMPCSTQAMRFVFSANPPPRL